MPLECSLFTAAMGFILGAVYHGIMLIPAVWVEPDTSVRSTYKHIKRPMLAPMYSNV